MMAKQIRSNGYMVAKVKSRKPEIYTKKDIMTHNDNHLFHQLT